MPEFIIPLSVEKHNWNYRSYTNCCSEHVGGLLTLFCHRTSTNIFSRASRIQSLELVCSSTTKHFSASFFSLLYFSLDVKNLDFFFSRMLKMLQDLPFF